MKLSHGFTLRMASAAFLGGAVLAGFAAGLLAANAGRGDRVTPVFAQALPNAPGKQLTSILVEYAPGGRSAPHHHHESAAIFAYVVSGAVRSKVNDGETQTYGAGQFWYEPPGAAHSISENASTTEPASILAVIVADEGAELTSFGR
jgi:quercetin dioxygenase-like cupin family protein